MNKFTDVDGNGKFNILLPLVLTKDQFLSVQFAIFCRNDNFFSVRNNSLNSETYVDC